VNIDDSVRALQCDKCCDDSLWKCGECLGLPVTCYESLLSYTGCELRWFCDLCSKHIMSDRDCISEKMDDINKTMDTLVDKINSIEARFDSEMDAKSDSPVTAKLDDINKKFENLIDRIQAIEVRLDTKPDPNQPKPESRDLQLLEEVQQRLEHKVDLLRTNIDEPVALAVHDVLQQDKAEELEIEKKKDECHHPRSSRQLWSANL